MSPVIVPFPQAGTAIVRANEAARIVDTSTNGEILICTVTSLGAGEPTFTFTRNGVEQRRAHQFEAHPKSQYQWVLSRDDGSLPDGKSVFVLALSFAATQYTYVMEHCDEFGGRIKLLKDIDYESADGEDSLAEAIQIFCE
jgi:hypothetical protein